MKNYLIGISVFLASVIVIMFFAGVYSGEYSGENSKKDLDKYYTLSLFILIICICLSNIFLIVNSILIHNKKIQEYEKRENTEEDKKVKNK